MGRHLRILVLDDEPIVGKRLLPALSKAGHEVEVFDSPQRALDRIASKQFDIVVTDIRMGEFDGIEVLQHVLQHWPATKVVIITGYASIELAREALAKGAFDFIAKPFRPQELRDVIARAAENLPVVAAEKCN